jgi:hypothetical protein
MDDFEIRLRKGMQALADAAIEPDVRSTTPVAATARSRGLANRGAGVVGLLLVAAVIVAILPNLFGPAGHPILPLPSGGVSEERAYELANSHVEGGQRLAAVAGRFGDFSLNATFGTHGISPDQWVWEVIFAETRTCDPTSVCASTAMGQVTVFIDYYTGEFLFVAEAAGSETPSDAGLQGTPSPFTGPQRT